MPRRGFAIANIPAKQRANNKRPSSGPYEARSLPGVWQIQRVPSSTSAGMSSFPLERAVSACQSASMSAPEQIARIRISLDHMEPEIWRVVDVPVAMHLQGLHDVIQAAMGWQNSHLFEFRIGEQHYGIPEGPWDREVRQAKSVKLSAVLAKGIKRFAYVYDFGDDWVHTLAIESVADGDPALKYPRFVAGARRCPPEDVGGPPGFFEFLQAMADPKHPEHRNLTEWHGGPFDADTFDELTTKLRIGALAKRRHAGKLGYEKSQALKR